MTKTMSITKIFIFTLAVVLMTTSIVTAAEQWYFSAYHGGKQTFEIFGPYSSFDECDADRSATAINDQYRNVSICSKENGTSIYRPHSESLFALLQEDAEKYDGPEWKADTQALS